MAKIPWITTKIQVLQFGAQIVFGVFGGAAVLAAFTGMAQKVMGLPLDWWILILVFVGGVLLMWWSRTALVSSALQSPGTAQSVPAQAPQLKSNQIIYPSPPSKNGVLWEWQAGQYGNGKMAGPFCPIHRVALFYWSFNSVKKAEFKEDDYLSGNGSFVCPLDDEEFTFIRPSAVRIRDVRTQAREQFQAEQQRKSVKEEEEQHNK